MKFIIIEEGKTEKKVLSKFLQRYINNNNRLKKRVGIKTIKREGSGELIDDLKVISRIWLDKKHSKDVIAVFGLADLYGLPLKFPKSKRTLKAKIEWAKTTLENKVKDERFRMFFAVHELEAWLLSDLEIFPKNIRKRLSKLKKDPEEVNFNEPPAKLLEKIYRSVTGKNYKKVTYGKQLFKNLNPETAAEKCPNLKKLLNEILTMAESAIQ